ncbi:MAG: hypothetical protein CMF38_00785 [Legionellaceae bacterium]|nr:hypothetical protein [Legionellaceae bacterium]|tara:strand:- start:2495 stop:3061 length:567 start_codon:yes stop_codon:yes gene_type:complete
MPIPKLTTHNFFPGNFSRYEPDNYFLPQQRLFLDDGFFESFHYVIDKNTLNPQNVNNGLEAALRIVSITLECIGTALSSLIAAGISVLRLILAPIILPIAKIIEQLTGNFPGSWECRSNYRSVFEKHLFDPAKILLASILSVIINLVNLPVAVPIALVKFGTRFGATVYEEYSKKSEDNFTTTVSSSF